MKPKFVEAQIGNHLRETMVILSKRERIVFMPNHLDTITELRIRGKFLDAIKEARKRGMYQHGEYYIDSKDWHSFLLRTIRFHRTKEGPYYWLIISLIKRIEALVNIGKTRAKRAQQIKIAKMYVAAQLKCSVESSKTILEGMPKQDFYMTIYVIEKNLRPESSKKLLEIYQEINYYKQILDKTTVNLNKQLWREEQ